MQKKEIKSTEVEKKDTPDLVAEAKKLSEEAARTLSELKTTQEEESKGRKQDSEKVARLEKSLGDALDGIQKLTGQIDAEKKAREAIETALARGPQSLDGKQEKTKPETKAAFEQFMRSGTLAAGFKAGGAAQNEIELKTLSTNVDSAGGYFVMPEHVDLIVGRNFETSPLRQVANVITTVSNAVEAIIDDDEASGGWANEGGTSSSTTTATVGKKTINVYKLDAEPKATLEMLQDAGLNVEQWHANKVADKFSRLENTAFISGNGVNKPRGILTFSNWSSAGVYERGKIEQIALGATATLTSDGLISQQGALKEVYQARAAWLMKRATYAAACKLKGSDNYYFGLTFLKDGIATPTLLGKRVIFADDMEAIAANALATAYGDFSVGYTIVDRLGLTVLRDPFTSKGNVIFYTTKRVGGDVTNFDAIKIGKLAVS